MPTIEEVHLSFVEDDGLALNNVPINERTPKVCLAAVSEDGEALEYVPQHMQIQYPEICSLALERNGLALVYITETYRTVFYCLKALKQNSKAIEFVPEAILTPEFFLAAVEQERGAALELNEQDNNNDIYLNVLRQYGQALKFIPSNRRTPLLCLTALQQDGWALSYVPKHERNQMIYLAALKQNARVLSILPEEEHSFDLYLAAVQQNGLALKFIPKHVIPARMHELYEPALRQNGLALEFIQNRKGDLCEIAVRQNGLALQYVPSELYNLDIFSIAVQQNGLALKFVPEDKRNIDICFDAVQHNAEALRFVPEKHKVEIIHKIGVKSIIENNYLAIKHFPKVPDFKNEIHAALANVTYISVGMPTDDPEVRDSQLVFLENKKKTSQGVVTILCDSNSKENVSMLLAELKEAKHADGVCLTLFSHGNVKSDEGAGLHYNEIKRITETHPETPIKRIKTFQCKAVKAKKPIQEIKMMEEYAKKSQYEYGLVATSRAPHKDKELQKKCATFCKKNNLHGVYVLNETEKGDYELLSMKYEQESGILTEKEVKKVLKPQEMEGILGGRKPIKFPALGNLMPIRGKGHPLSAKELAALRDTAYEGTRFEKAHSKYKHNKKKYIAEATIDAEVSNLENSFLKKLADALQSSELITWDMTLEGSTKAMHVDTITRSFKATKGHLYKKPYNRSLFSCPDPEMLDSNKLKKERHDTMQEKKTNGPDKNESVAKKLRVVIRKK